MSAKDINKQPYDESTLTKLEIFEQYLTEWLPVFVEQGMSVMVCDFFAGSGQDAKGEAGSPLRILRTVEKYRDRIFQKKVRVDVLLNEISSSKLDELRSTVAAQFDLDSWAGRLAVEYHNSDFQELFRQRYVDLQKQPNLLFFDQSGVKEVVGEVFQHTVALKATDFLFFISSSFLRRFAESAEFRAYFPDIDPDELATVKYEHIHRTVLEYYRSKVPDGNNTKLFPYSLKKGANIYGIVFGSKHPLGVEKFLRIAWNENNVNGEANFDIHDDIQKRQRVLFEPQKMTKLEYFESLLEEYVRHHGEVTNRQVYRFTLLQGHATSHARKCLARLKKEGKVEYKGSIGISYDSCVKDGKPPKIIRWKDNG